jgi:hypothetical protein
MLSTYDREDSSQNILSYSSSSSLPHIEGNKANYFTENSNDDYICPNNIIINSLDIADGLKELLIKYRFTLEELSSMPFLKLAEFLGIDLCVARIICTAARKLSDCNYHI